MFADAPRPRDLHDDPIDPTEFGAAVPDPNHVAVLLNARARRVSDRFAAQAEAEVGAHNVYYSHDLGQAEAFARQIVQRGYGTVVCGGGDGTLMAAYNFIQRYVDEANAWRRERRRRYGEVQKPLVAPRLAFLSLGTGNGLRHVVGAREPLADLRQIVAGRAPCCHEVTLIHSLGQYFTFGGLGYDSMLLNDYNVLRTHAVGTLMRPLVQSVAGYFAAVFTRTLPRALREAPLTARIEAHGSSLFIDPRRGDAASELGQQAVLYDGPVSMVGVGTTPFFGYGLRMFPFAAMRAGMMQLRVAHLGPLKALWNLPGVWRGQYRNHAQMFDFLTREVSITLSRAYPFQHSGDDQGQVQKMHLKVADQRLRLVDMTT